MTKILLIGASGRTGRQIARLLDAERRGYRALVRQPELACEATEWGREPFVADLHDDITAAFRDVTTVIFAAGSSETEGAEFEERIDRDAAIRAVDAARQERVCRFVMISALSAYWPESSPAALRHYSQMKRAADDYLVASGVPYLILRPGPLSDESPRGTLGWTDVRTSDMDALARADLATIIIEAMRQGLDNMILGICGGTLDIHAALAAFKTGVA